MGEVEFETDPCCVHMEVLGSQPNMVVKNQTGRGRISCTWKITWGGCVLYFITLTWLIVRHTQNSRTHPVYPYVLEWGQPELGAIEGPDRQYTEAPPKEEIRTRKIITTTTEQEVHGWERTVPRDPTQYIEPFKDTTTIPGHKICPSHTITLAIIVTTQPSSFWQRKLIRETWGSSNITHVKIGFFVGSTTNSSIQIDVEHENEQFQDIIQEQLIDTYNNLTLKSILLLKWFIRYCRTAKFLMKCDADTFVDVKLLVSQLAKYKPKRMLMGYLCVKCWVFRDVQSAWYVPNYLFANNTYPSFLLGYSYIMSMDVAIKLYDAALRTPIFYLEDVYITGICAKVAGVRPKQFPGSAPYVHNIKKVCRSSRSMCHPVWSDGMHRLWKSRNSPRPPKWDKSKKILKPRNDTRMKVKNKNPSTNTSTFEESELATDRFIRWSDHNVFLKIMKPSATIKTKNGSDRNATSKEISGSKSQEKIGKSNENKDTINGPKSPLKMGKSNVTMRIESGPESQLKMVKLHKNLEIMNGSDSPLKTGKVL